MLVLVVDDCTAMRHLLRRELRHAGLPDSSVVDVADGESALAQLDRLTPSVVLADQSLPDMTGVRLLDAVGRRLGAQTTRVLVTADRSRSTLLEARAAGVSAVLGKPFSAEDITRVLSGDLPDLTAVLNDSSLVAGDGRPVLPLERQVQTLLQTLFDREVELSPGLPVLPRPGRGVTTAAYVDDRLRTAAALAADRPLSLALVAALELDPESITAQARFGASARANLQEVAEIAASLFVPDAGPYLRLYGLHLPGELPPRVTGTAVAALRSRLDLRVVIEGYGEGSLSLVVPSRVG